MRTRTRICLAAALAVAAVAAPAAGSPSGSHARPRVTLVAYARGRAVPVYARPGTRRPVRVLENPYHGTRLSFLVRRARPGWVRVFLPVRPNGSSGWVWSRHVRLLRDEYRVRVDLGRHLLRVWRRGRLVLREPVGVGRDETPTPVGRFYVVELIQTPDPDGPYGPYAFGLSAHSSVIEHFGGGDGQVGIHGTNEPQGLGTDVSHGCIRIGNDAIVRLAKTLPLGTPVDVVAGSRPERPRARPTAVPPAPRVRPRPARPARPVSPPLRHVSVAAPEPPPLVVWIDRLVAYLRTLVAALPFDIEPL